MALKRNRVKVNPVNFSSVVFGDDREPNFSSYYESFQLGKLKRPRRINTKYEVLPITQTFLRNEITKLDNLKTEAQESYSKVTPAITSITYKERRKVLKEIMTSNTGTSVANIEISPAPNSQMRMDYLDRQLTLPKWMDIAAPKLPRLPRSIEKPTTKSFGGQTEQSHQYQWPKQDRDRIYQVTFYRK